MKFTKKILVILSFLLAAIFTFGIVACKDGGDTGGTDNNNYKPVDAENYDYDRFDDDANFDSTGFDDNSWKGATSTEITGGYEKGTARAPQTSEYLGSVERVKPVDEIRNEGKASQYPTYGSNLKFTINDRDGIYWESISLLPEPTWRSQKIYNGIDAEGYLIKNGARVSDGNGGYKQLYAHTASTSMYGGGLSDDEPRIVKKITAVTHTKLSSTQITGLYAPAGEVIKVQMSESDYKNSGGIAVYIGQNYNLDQQVAMEFTETGVKGTGLNRMTDILSKFELRDAYHNVTIEDGIATAYVGSFLGGPIYFRPLKNDAERNISVTFSGGVRYQHFILGVTTPEEYEANKKSTAPYFDLEVYDSVRFTTHKYANSGGLALKDYTYQNCTDAAVLWDKIAEVSTRVGANGLSASSAPVYVIGDCYIAAGAAFANPGRNGVVCPPNWLAEALNYNNFVNSGCWGTMHEYNHCWQGYGVANNGEVTNNATTLVAYSLYTRISAGRTSAVGWKSGDWNRFTDPSRSLGELLNGGANGSKRFDLSVYATLLHNIGQDNFVEAAKGGGGNGGNYYGRLVNATHYDMSYFFTEVMNFDIGESYASGGTIAQSQIDSAKENNYPMFVPVSSVYQVGRSIIYDGEKKYITTAQPYSYGYGEFVMDFNNYNNFKQGSFVSKNLVIPDGFTVSVESVTQPENGTVELLENNQVKYTPKNGNDGLYSGNFRVKLRIVKDDLKFIVEDVDLVINLKQNKANTSLNRTTYIYDDAAKVPDTAAVYNAETKTFNFGEYANTETIKNVCTQETNTQIWAADRNYYDDVYNANSTNYVTLDVNKTIQTLEGVMYFSSAGNYRFTLKGRGKSTLYLSFDGGITWEAALTINRTSGNAYDANEYHEYTLSSNKNYVHYKVVHSITQTNTFFGIGVSKQNSDGTYPAFANAKDTITFDSVELDKAINEDSAKKFETDYHFKNVYGYSYTSTENIPVTDNKLVYVSHNPWNDTLQIGNLFDGNANTYYHSEQNVYITEEAPFELMADLGSVRRVNRVTFNGFSGSIGNNGMVKTFKIYGSIDGKDYFLLTEVTDSAANARTMTFNFDTVQMRYYRLVVTKTDNGRYFAMNSVVFSNYLNFPNGTLVSPTDSGVRYIGNGWSTKNLLCNFGIAYTAGVGDSMEYHFNGTRVAYFAYQSADYGTVDIYIDGELVASDVSLSANKNVGSLAYMYTGDALSNGEHVLKIVGKSGKFNIDSFAYWN